MIFLAEINSIILKEKKHFIQKYMLIRYRNTTFFINNIKLPIKRFSDFYDYIRNDNTSFLNYQVITQFLV